MKKYNEKISDRSVWTAATPTELAKTLPFYFTEAGHFIAEKDYMVKREMHDSFLMIYTIKGQGFLRTNDIQINLQPQNAVIIDCHLPHEYHSVSEEWEFLWIHFAGSAAASLFNIIYTANEVCAVHINSSYDFEQRVKKLLNKSGISDIVGYNDISAQLHIILNMICASGMKHPQIPNDDINMVIDFIENNYYDQITIDDMTKNTHISKYHFIRLFRRAMGITPYQYLMNYRINVSKTLLRTTNKSVTQIAELCGFLDASNFTSKFKKHTGQRPLEYRRDFS